MPAAVTEPSRMPAAVADPSPANLKCAHSYYWYCFILLFRYQAAAVSGHPGQEDPHQAAAGRGPRALPSPHQPPIHRPTNPSAAGPLAATAAGAGTPTCKGGTGTQNRFSCNTTQVFCMPELLSSSSCPQPWPRSWRDLCEHLLLGISWGPWPDDSSQHSKSEGWHPSPLSPPLSSLFCNLYIKELYLRHKYN
jgi:hypothetical protein